jgi:hypothetical protein
MLKSWVELVFYHAHFFILMKGWLMSLITCIIWNDIINPRNMLPKGPSIHPSKILNFIVRKCELRILPMETLYIAPSITNLTFYIWDILPWPTLSMFSYLTINTFMSNANAKQVQVSLLDELHLHVIIIK